MSAREYIQAVLGTYITLPGTPNRARRDDRYLALKLYRQGVALFQVEGGLLLATARRVFREEQPPLQPIRSLRYFVGAIEEVRDSGVDEAYPSYLRGKLSHLLHPKAVIEQRERARAACSQRRTARQLYFEW